jgi:RNA-directed DNA polymerase
MRCLERRIADRSVLALIRKWLKCPLIEGDGQGGDKATKPKQGTPQGGVISPLLANIFLHELDRQFYGSKGPSRMIKAKLVRYADDLVILANDIDDRMTNYGNQILQRLELSLNQDKSRIADLRQEGERLDFLGFTFLFDRNRFGPGSYLNIVPLGQVDESISGELALDDSEASPTPAGGTNH